MNVDKAKVKKKGKRQRMTAIDLYEVCFNNPCNGLF